MSAEKIVADWKKGVFKPVYWIEGDESYYIDKVINYAEHHILSESEAGFNLTVFYGKDADWTAIVNACRRYPMFAERQVVLLKEAQHMKQVESLSGYIENPLNSTIFVVGHKEKKIDGRSTFGKMLKKNTVYLECKKMYENQLPDWTRDMIKAKGFDITEQALQLLIDHIGSDLSRLENEIDKTALNLKGKKKIDEGDIEKYIGISKEFNVFELQAAIAKKDLPKAIRIIQYFEHNPKAAPIQQVLPTLYSFFSKVYSIFGMTDTSENALKIMFSNNYYAGKEGMAAAKTHGEHGVEKILLLLHEYNLRSIGINDSGTEDAGLLKEMVVKMMS